MKLLLSIFCVLILAYPGGIVAQEETQKTNLFFGSEYDESEDAITGTLGVTTSLVGGMMLIARTQVGEYNSLETDAAFLLPLGTKFYFGVLAGPNAEFAASEDAVTYIVGASGAVLGYRPGKVGIWAAAKYTFAFEDGVAYQDGWRGGIFLSFPLVLAP